MQEGGGDQPRHERSVLDRIPEPEATPAQFIVSPPGAHRDADSEEYPGGERPWPDPARPRRIDLAVDQRGHGKGERD